MSEPGEQGAFERQLCELLERHARAASGRVRSRLTQARHVALARAGEPRGAWPRGLTPRRLWLPAAGILAAAAGWVMVSGTRHVRPPPAPFSAGVVMPDDVALLTDRDGLALVRGGDGQFYEWAVAQARHVPLSKAANDEPGRNGG